MAVRALGAGGRQGSAPTIHSTEICMSAAARSSAAAVAAGVLLSRVHSAAAVHSIAAVHSAAAVGLGGRQPVEPTVYQLTNCTWVGSMDLQRRKISHVCFGPEISRICAQIGEISHKYSYSQFLLGQRVLTIFARALRAYAHSHTAVYI